jgi:nucleolar complex protein 2
MGKKTKRERKFKATGGPSARKKAPSKPNKRQKTSIASDKSSKNITKSSSAPHREEKVDDLTNEKNLGQLDLDSFFKQFSDDDDDDDDDNNSKEVHGAEKSVSSACSANSDEVDEHSNDDVVDATKSDSEESNSEDEEQEDIEVSEARMRAQMEKIKRSDPEFHEFLKENEQSLLDFGQDEENEVSDDDVKKNSEKDERIDGDGMDQLTPELLSSMKRAAFQQHSIKNLKKIMFAYHAACHMADDANEKKNTTQNIFFIEPSKVFDQLMMACLNHCHKEFEYHLLAKEDDDDNSSEDNKEESKNEHETKDNEPLAPNKLEKSERWTDLSPIIRAFFRSTLHVLNESKEPELLAELLKALSKYLRYLTPFPRISEFMLKTLEALWSAPSDSEDYQHVRLHAFMRLRQLALVLPFPFIEDVLKKSYLGYSRRAKFGTASNLPTLTFLGNCLVELYNLDYHSSYQHAFVYIRQLALLLRSAMQNKTTEAISQVYCWQFIHCAKLWVAVLSSAAEHDDGALMQSLIYPMVEILLGTVRFTPSPVRHFPLRLHCVRLLQQLAAASETFIPTTALLLDVFDWKEWTLPPKKSKKATIMAKHGSPLHFMVKLGKVDPLRTHEQLEAGISELFVLLHREVELYKYSPGFPEFAIRITARLRQFSKTTRNARWRAYVKACIEVCDKYSKNWDARNLQWHPKM